MGVLLKYRHNSIGMIGILRSGWVEADLQRRANRVAQQVREELANESHPPEIIADTQVGRNRAGATIIGVPMRIEAKRRILGRAIDAAK